MLSRLFHITPKRDEKKEEPYDWDVSLDEFQAQLRLPKLDNDQIRVLIFRDCDKRGKTLLFDSNAMVPVEAVNESTDASPSLVRGSVLKGTAPGMSRSSSPKKYQRLKPSSDTNLLGEMVFGSVAMSYKGSTIKIHLIRSPLPQLLVSKVFALKARSTPSGISESDLTTSNSHSESLNSSGRDGSAESVSVPLHNDGSEKNLSGSSSNPMPTPTALQNSAFNTSLFGGSLSSIDSLNMSASATSLYTPSPSPGGSLHRRWCRSQATSLGFNHFYRGKSENLEENFSAQRKQPKIGISIMLKLWEGHEEKCRAFQNFFFAHYTLFEAHIQKIRVAVEKAIYLKKNFIAVAIEETEKFKTDIGRLYCSPRIIEPVWLNVMGTENQQSDVVQRFISCFMNVIGACEKKETNHFLSSVLTAVLTHHLAWVPTVTPSGSLPIRSYLDKHSSKTVDILAKCHPYNPLWAQLGDLYGTIGFPLKISKTIVVGKQRSLVCQLLYILSYFIRCSDVTEHVLKAEKNIDYISEESCAMSQTPSSVSSLRSWMGKSTPVLSPDGAETLSSNNNAETPGNLPDSDKCECLCNVLQNIDYVGDKNIRNLQGYHSRALDRVIEREQSEELSNAIINVMNSNKEIYRDGSFMCYCHAGNTRNMSEHAVESQCTDGNILKNKSIVTNCKYRALLLSRLKVNGYVPGLEVEKRDSGGEFDQNCGHDTNTSAISRTSSFISCSDLSKDVYSQDLDSDYCSIANEDLLLNHDSTDGLAGKDLYRHLSDDSTSDEDMLDLDFIELPLLSSRERKSTQRNPETKSEPCNFGRSLLAGYCEKQISDFVLQGVESYDHESMMKDLQFSVGHSVLDEPVGDAACIVADTDNWTCTVWTFQRRKDPLMHSISEHLDDKVVVASEMVSEMVESVRGLGDVSLPLPFCLMHIEDSLKNIYTQSKVVAEFARSGSVTVPRSYLEKKFRFHESDLDLLVAAASTHSPYVSQLIE